MLYYIVPFLFLQLSLMLFYALPSNKRNLPNAKFLFFIGLIPTLLIVSLKGDVGTDTWNYFGMAEAVIHANSLIDTLNDVDIELGFGGILGVMSLISDSPRLVINLISLIIVLYAYFLFSKKMYAILIFCILIYPVFIYDMSMNGLRYGLAFLMAKHASGYLNADKKKSTFLLLMIASSIQMSSILVFILLQLKRLNPSYFKYLIPFLCGFVYLFQDRLLYKYEAYQSLEATGPLSGLLPLFLFLTTYVSLALLDTKFILRLLLLCVIEALSFVLAGFSYAGLRFQLLTLFVLFCYVSDLDITKYRYKKIALVLFFLIGCLGFGGKLRNFSDGADIPPTPFLPYQFYWEST